VLARNFNGGNFLFWLLGGFIFSLLWSLAKPKSFMCSACDHLFTAWTFGSQLWFTLLLILLGLSALGIWLELYGEMPEPEAPFEF